jgi:Predicted membrane protein (DUF2231)
MRQACR